ncbi:hypothetical protein OE749_06945 [Aestuariibacter sp. AA17]|uniref:Acid-resistance membrane protein n=1 Tax=Fluctibacter corallii TaxID=2984329 RepID=A0ABT3A6W3_9ALTE|nr:hypothetical protein [Aestuariibacter sp. AA17]MCV2884427.1 hypothetical protein [Aestuariibacter sp. AA17]
MDSVTSAQKDMRAAYCFGIPGIIASGSVWLVAGLAALLSEPLHGVITLIFGGMVIFPASIVLCRVFGYSGKHAKGNPLAPLAIEGTIWMLLSIVIAIVLATFNMSLFFPAMLFIIAGRYLTFATLYGNQIFYLFSVSLVLAGLLLSIITPPIFVGGLVGGLVEIVFALVIYIRVKI